MMRCITIKSSSSCSTTTTLASVAASPAASGNGRERSPICSPTVNLSTREYTLAVQTKSFKEIWYQIHIPEEEGEEREEEEIENIYQVRQHQPQVLRPNKECVEEALRAMPDTALNRLISSYFTHSETTTHHCLHLKLSVDRAIINYAGINDLFKNFPFDVISVTKSQCKLAHEIFVKFDNVENPFPNSELHHFHEMRLCLSDLKQQLDRRLGKSKTRTKLVRRAKAGSALCFIGTAFGVAVSAVAIVGHAVVALAVAGAFTPALLCPPQPRLAKKELSHMAQPDAVYKGIYVLNNDLDTINSLVDSLYTAVEGDKNLIRIGLCGEGRDKHSIFEVVKLLRKNQVNIVQQLEDLKQHICLCCVAINSGRSLLLQRLVNSNS